MKEWSIGQNAYGGTSIFEGRKERYSNVQKLDCDFTADELAGIVRDHNTAPELYEALKECLAVLQVQSPSDFTVNANTQIKIAAARKLARGLAIERAEKALAKAKP